MRAVDTKRLLVIVIFFFSISSWANRHEHFFSWPISSAIFESYSEVYGGSIGDLNAFESFMIFTIKDDKPSEDIFYNVLTALYSEDEIKKLTSKLDIEYPPGTSLFRKELAFHLKDKTLNEVVELLTDQKTGSNKHSEKLKKIFKFQSDSKKGDYPYLVKEMIRQKIFLEIKDSTILNKRPNSPEQYSSFLEKVFIKTAEKVEDSNDYFVGMSVPNSFYKSNLKNIKDKLAKRGVHIDFYLSVPRVQLTSTNTKKVKTFLRSTSRKINNSIAEGWGTGLDITGSIFEKPEDFNFDAQTNLRTSLSTLYDTLINEKQTLMRVHAFEVANTGSFYQELFKFLENKLREKTPHGKTPPTISIGHISTLSDRDIERFQEINNKALTQGIPFKLVFDANISSNSNLHDSDPRKLAIVISKLKKAGLEVGLGADGTGILGRTSSVMNQAKILGKSDLSNQEIHEIIDASKKAPMCDINRLGRLMESFF